VPLRVSLLSYHLVIAELRLIETYDTAAKQKLARPRDFNMSDEPTDPPANEADDSEPQDSDADASTGTGDTQITIPDGLGHLITGFLSSITPDDFGNPGTWGFPYHHPRPPVVVSPNRALQNYLLQVQALAGIPPQQANPMESARPSRRGTGPVMLHLGDDGCRLAIVPPATFNGTLWPLFIREPRPATAERSNGADSDGTVSIISPLLKSEEFKHIFYVLNTDCFFLSRSD
jgi:hypothetical protein